MNNNKIIINEIYGNNIKGQIPIWFMRQAGRYLPEYRELKNKHPSFIDMCLTPSSVKEITLQPLKRFNFDAAILFSDILIIPYSMGLALEFKTNIGPVFNETSQEKRVNTIIEGNINRKNIDLVLDGVKRIKSNLEENYNDKSLIGFCGSPFTVACYVINGMGSKDYNDVRKYYFDNKNKFLTLIDRITSLSIDYLKKQIDSGAEIIKIFDSWAGVLAEEEYEKLVIKPNKIIIQEIKNYNKNIPIIAFPKGSGVKYNNFIEKTDVDVIAIDHTVPKLWARDNLQKKCAIQGNLDNVVLTSEVCDIKNKVLDILNVFSKGRFIFNLGHGVLQNSIIEKVYEVVKIVKNYER